MIDEELIIEIWETFRDYIPEKTRETAANQFLEFLQAHDVDEDTLEGLKGYDPHLDDAIELSLGSEEEEMTTKLTLIGVMRTTTTRIIDGLVCSCLARPSKSSWLFRSLLLRIRTGQIRGQNPWKCGEGLGYLTWYSRTTI
jgi:hypothetical protein